MYNKPLIVHTNSKKLYVLDWLDPDRKLANKLLSFTDVLQTPERVSTFQISPYTLWTAAAKDVSAEEICKVLEEYSYTSIPSALQDEIYTYIQAYGTLEFYEEEGDLLLIAKHESIIQQIKSIDAITLKSIGYIDKHSMRFPMRYRIEIKKILFEHGVYVKDYTFDSGEPLGMYVSSKTVNGEKFIVRDYQEQAANSFLKYEGKAGGGGTIIMPPGSGKTIVALKIMEALQINTLILVENQESANRWQQELLDKTDLTESYIGLYDKNRKKFYPVTIGTYVSISKEIELFHNFGLVIYDDAHRVLAETYEKTIGIRARYRLALASTLARSDRQGEKILALVGPKWYEILYQDLVKAGYNIPVTCVEIRVPLSKEEQKQYKNAKGKSNKIREIAALNKQKNQVVETLLKEHINKQVMITSYRKELILRYEKHLRIDAIYGGSDESHAAKLVQLFNTKQVSWLNIASLTAEKMLIKGIEVIIATSYQQGSEREEYLRIGKLLPIEGSKKEGVLYSLVSDNTIEEKDYRKRRMRLLHYGFPYIVRTAEDIQNGGESYEIDRRIK